MIKIYAIDPKENRQKILSGVLMMMVVKGF